MVKFSFKRLFGKSNKQDALFINMQNEIIRIASTRIGKPLSKSLISNIRQAKWSYMGLEMIIDTVTSIDTAEIESYLSKLK